MLAGLASPDELHLHHSLRVLSLSFDNRDLFSYGEGVSKSARRVENDLGF
jgi:hypothetical protein